MLEYVDNYDNELKSTIAALLKDKTVIVYYTYYR